MQEGQVPENDQVSEFDMFVSRTEHHTPRTSCPCVHSYKATLGPLPLIWGNKSKIHLDNLHCLGRHLKTSVSEKPQFPACLELKAAAGSLWKANTLVMI